MGISIKNKTIEPTNGDGDDRGAFNYREPLTLGYCSQTDLISLKIRDSGVEFDTGQLDQIIAELVKYGLYKIPDSAPIKED